MRMIKRPQRAALISFSRKLNRGNRPGPASRLTGRLSPLPNRRKPSKKRAASVMTASLQSPQMKIKMTRMTITSSCSARKRKRLTLWVTTLSLRNRKRRQPRRKTQSSPGGALGKTPMENRCRLQSQRNLAADERQKRSKGAREAVSHPSGSPSSLPLPR